MMILAYHSILDNKDDLHSMHPDKFRDDMNWLSDNGYRCVNLGDYMLEANLTGLPKKTLILTFDDGFRDFIDNAFILLRDLKFSATLFIVAELVGGVSEWRSKEFRYKLMSWDNISMLDSLGFRIGSHGLRHKRLIELNKKGMEHEIIDSKKMIEEHIGRPVLSFSYPWCVFDNEVRSIVRNANYRYAVAGDNGNSGLLSLKRRPVHIDESVRDFLK